MEDAHRQKGKISYVKVENYRGEKDDPNTAWVGVDFNGSGQGFGGLYLDEKAIIGFQKSLTEVFGVEKFEDLVGKECYALRSFSNWNATITGLESFETGRRMTVNDFRRAMGYKVELNELQESIKRTNESIAFHERRAAEERLEIVKLKRGQDYVEWDKE